MVTRAVPVEYRITGHDRFHFSRLRHHKLGISRVEISMIIPVDLHSGSTRLVYTSGYTLFVTLLGISSSIF